MSSVNDSSILAAINNSLSALAERDRHYANERAAHVGDIKLMNSTIAALTRSNEEVNKNITKLVAQSRSSELHIKLIHELVITKASESKEQIDDLDNRVCALEREHHLIIGERRANERYTNFWSNNWFKIVSLFVLSVPLIAGAYTLLHK